MKTFLRGCQLAGLLALAAMLGGCVTADYRPGDRSFEALSNRTIYALVRYVHPGPSDSFVKRYCDLTGHSDPLCSVSSTADHVSVAIGRDAWGIKIGGLLVPKAAHVAVGDIVEYRFASDKQPYNKFVRIAARAADTKGVHCGWVGSKIAFSGGVVCDGWRYDKDFPLLAN